MKLTAEQQQVFADWLREKMEHHCCVLCQSNQWKVGELVHPAAGELVTEEFDGSHSPGRVELICRNCGHVLLFDVRYIRNWNREESSHSSVM